MRKRNVLAALMAGAMAIGSLAGCGGGGNTTTTAAGTENSTTAAGESSAAADSASGDQVTIKVSLWDYSNTEYYKTMISAFEAKYPNIKVEPVEASAAEYDDLIQVKLASKEDFDVVFTKGTPALSALVAKGHVMALDDFIAQDNLDLTSYSGLAEQLQLGGQTYAIPFRKDNNLIFYNKDLFDAAGVAYPEDGMTFDEYRELAKQMTSGEGNSKVYGAHVHTWASNANMFPRRTEEYDPFAADKDVLLPYYQTILAMQNEDKSIMDYGSLKASSTHYSGVFYNQQVAMLQMGTWFINNLLENVDFNWGVCSLPSVSGEGNDKAVGGVTPVSIGAYAKHPEEAWKFIEYVTGEEGALVLAETGIVPGYNSDKINEIFDALASKKEGIPENLSKYIDIDTYVVEMPMNEKGREVDKIITEEHDLIMTNSMSAEDGLKEMAERVNEVLGQ
ncbi:MAG: sugar ABC transporter substrate-binding protein [bacterium]|nr:sugar ABC transporter substrate-binding protein [bacterium]